MRGAGPSTCPAYRLRVSFVRALALVAALGTSGCTAATPAHVDLPRRIVSLIPSLTEDLFAVGAGPLVVGVSQYTDFPRAATTLPVVATFASADVERIVRLQPDIVVGIPSQSASAAAVRKTGIRTVLLDDDTFEDIFRDLEALGLLTGRDDAAHGLTDRLRARTTALMRTVRKRAHPLRAFVVLGVAPIFTVGDASYIAKLIELAGGTNGRAVAPRLWIVQCRGVAGGATRRAHRRSIGTVAIRARSAPVERAAARRSMSIASVISPDPGDPRVDPVPATTTDSAWLIRIFNTTHV